MADGDWNPWGREYTPAEVAAAKRLGLAEQRKGEPLRGPLIFAGGPWHPDEARRMAADWALVSQAMDREWVKPLRADEAGDGVSTDEQSQMVDDISSIIMRGRYGRSGVGRPSDNPLDLRDARRIVEYVMARDARVCRDVAREALDGLSAWLGELAERHPARSSHVPLMQAHITRYTTDNYPEETP